MSSLVEPGLRTIDRAIARPVRAPRVVVLRRGLSAALLVMALGGATAAAATKATVHLTERSTIAGPRVRLGLLARIDASDPALARKLDAVTVGLAPAPGQSRFLERSEIEEAIAIAGFPPWDIELQGATRIQLTRVAQLVPESRLARALLSALARELGLNQAELSFRRLQFLSSPRVGGGSLDVDAEFLTEPRLEAPLEARVVVLVDGVPSAQIPVELEAVRRRDEAPADRPIPRRRRERVIRSGQQVRIELEGPGLQITALGKARSAGALGDQIPVENTISGIIVRGVVKGEGLVQVYWSPVTGLEGVTEK